jgi:hypothetical protein
VRELACGRLDDIMIGIAVRVQEFCQWIGHMGDPCRNPQWACGGLCWDS